ncbi:unnamed protein product [Phaedon cochleariae]|uniref:Cytochrome P450 n=1 Tax=Phaedon cochleariae TaxID=80249 RepID=A0A9P0DXI9_PHACE|nr:unnamed protein product [Phaedon cochleariae]
MFLLIFAMLASVIAFLYYLLHMKMDHWRKRGVPGPSCYPIVGNFGEMIMGRRGINQIYSEIYRRYEGYPFVGVFKFMIPVLVVRDPDLIKCIMLKDFGSFQKNDMFADKNVDPIFSRNPFVLEGSEWKARRAEMISCLSPAKIKDMFVTLEKNSRNMVHYIDKQLTNSNSFDVTDILRRLLIENIAACGLGVEGKCFEQEISEVKKMADYLITAEGLDSFLIAFWVHFPRFSKLCNFRIFTQEIEDKFISIMRSTLKFRKDNNMVVNDFLQAAAQPYSEQTLSTDYDIAAHIASLFTDGYLSTANSMAFILFELAVNKDIQDKLRAEIIECYERNGGKFDYEDTMRLEYLEACIHEGIRKHPIVPVIPKICTEKFTYSPTNPEYKNLSVTIEPGTSICIPAYAIHHDPKFFEDPEKFMPERFMIKNGINKYTYLGFGVGHRMCIGSRFAMTQMKIGLAHFIKNFEVKTSPKTRYPLKYDPWYFVLSVRDGIWVEIQNLQDK